jgi:beta-lactamase class A
VRLHLTLAAATACGLAAAACAPAATTVPAGPSQAARAAAVDYATLRAAVELRTAALRARAPDAVVAVAVRDLAPGGGALDVAPDSVFHAASTMKQPVLIEVVRRAERGGPALDDAVPLVNRFASAADGSPYALDAADDADSSLYARVGTRVPVGELARRMIVRSSNLATNALVDLVGAAATTATARALGAARVEVRRGVEDNAAFRAGIINTTTAPDLAALLDAVERGRAASPAATRWMREVLLAQEFSAEIPAGVPPGTPVAHKTGWITGVLHDAAVVYPRGRAPYVLVVLTRGVPDRAAARAAIVDVSRLVYDALDGRASHEPP